MMKKSGSLLLGVLLLALLLAACAQDAPVSGSQADGTTQSSAASDNEQQPEAGTDAELAGKEISFEEAQQLMAQPSQAEKGDAPINISLESHLPSNTSLSQEVFEELYSYDGASIEFAADLQGVMVNEDKDKFYGLTIPKNENMYGIKANTMIDAEGTLWLTNRRWYFSLRHDPDWPQTVRFKECSITFLFSPPTTDEHTRFWDMGNGILRTRQANPDHAAVTYSYHLPVGDDAYINIFYDLSPAAVTLNVKDLLGVGSQEITPLEVEMVNVAEPAILPIMPTAYRTPSFPEEVTVSLDGVLLPTSIGEGEIQCAGSVIEYCWASAKETTACDLIGLEKIEERLQDKSFGSYEKIDTIGDWDIYEKKFAEGERPLYNGDFIMFPSQREYGVHILGGNGRDVAEAWAEVL